MGLANLKFIFFTTSFLLKAYFSMSQFAENMDGNVDDVIKAFFPKDHQPALMENKVYVVADLYNIIDVNEVSETITTKLWLYLAYLVWMPEEVWNEKLPYVYRFFPGTNRIWKPDVIILNNVATESVNGNEPYVLRYHCHCAPQGCPYCGAMVIFPSAITEKTTCGFDVTNFPFDVQECKIGVGPWITDITSVPRFRDLYGRERGPYRISIPNEATSMSLRAYKENSQWDLLEATVENKTRTAETDVPVEYDYLEYTLKMKRKPHFYVYTIILPCSCLTLLAVLSVYIPVESGEKIGLGVTLLLAQVVNLLILSSILPASSQFFPHLGFYFLGTIIIISVSLIYNALIISVYYHGYPNVLKVFCWKRKRGNATVFPENLSPRITKGNGNVEQMLKALEGNIEREKFEVQQALAEDEEEKRRKRCRIADHVFAMIIFSCVLILHVVYFQPYFL